MEAIQKKHNSDLYFPQLSVDQMSVSNMSQKAYLMLKKAILYGELPMDVPISQVHLAEMFGVSRTPLREAINKLQQEHLIRYEANKRIIIPSCTAEDVDQLLAMRIMMECLAVRITIPIIKIAQIEKLQEIYDDMYSTPTSNQQKRGELHQQFHEKLCEGAGEYLREEIKKLREQSIRYQIIYLEDFEFDVKSHQRLLDACKKQDALQVSNELALHYSQVAFSVLNKIDPIYEPLAVRQALRLNVI